MKEVIFTAILFVGMTFSVSSYAETLEVVKDGESLAPIIVFEDAPPFTAAAASELAEYIEKTSGALPDVIEGAPDPVPERAIWVGYQSVLDELFPDLDFDFQHPEEILIAANGSHLVIAGRDRWDPENMTIKDRRDREIDGVQREYGTVNAVYTFLQDYLGVRWLWPGELGVDVLERPTIAFEPFEFRYHPQFRSRNIFHIYGFTRRLRGHEWARYQRLQLDSLSFQAGHPFSNWWGRFHETHPEYFALQPDGTRGGGDQPYPSARTVKMCKSNPDLWAQWLDDVEDSLARNPNRRSFGANANDGWRSGYCICDDCLAWDHPEGASFQLSWEGISQNYVAMSDRQITFANTLARKLRERFPDQKDLLVSAMAYGASRLPPAEAVADDNVLVSGVWNFHNQPNDEHREWFVEWSKVTDQLAWRPNLGGAGWKIGFPNVAPHRVIEDMRFVADHGVIGLSFDGIFGHWAAQGPHYYMLAQMAWDPYADGETILEDYYQRAFGAAAETMAGYWKVIEQAATRIVFEDEGARDVWNEDFFEDTYGRLDRAAEEAAAEGGDVYAERVAYVRSGLDYLRLMQEMRPLLDRLRETGGQDAEAMAAAQAQWDEAWEKIESIKKEYPLSIPPFYVHRGWSRLRGYSPEQFE